MRPVDFRLNGVSAEWDGAPNASESVIKVNGTEVARNLARTPGTDSVYYTDYIGWAGNSNERLVEWVDADWSTSGKASRLTYTVIGNATSGDAGLYVRDALTPGKVYTTVVRGRTSRAEIRLGASKIYSNIGDIVLIAGTTSENTNADSGFIRWVTFIAPDSQLSDTRLLFTVSNKQAGDWIELSMGDIYEGPYDPNRPWFSGDSTPEQLMQSPTIGSPLEGSLEDIAGPLVAELTSSGTVDAPLDPLSSRTLVCVTKDRSAMSSYYAFCYNGVYGNNGRIDLRTYYDSATLGTRFDAEGGSENATSSLLFRGSKPFVFGVILNENISDDKSYIQMFDSNGLGGSRYVNFGNGITGQKFTKTDNAIWAGLWPKALTEDEIAKVTLWLKQRYL